jgi:hypothetical protein
MLRSDGAIHQTSIAEIAREELLPKAFAPASLSEIANELRLEFGSRFQVRWEQPYLVVTRTTGSAFWGEKFRALHASMKQFCRGYEITTRDLAFPLVTVILGSRQEFRQYCQAQGVSLPAGCVGIYSQKSNRIVLYEEPSEREREQTIDTIRHEAAHQLAFNLGLHQRCAATPLWLAEGFATMFEAPRYVQPMNQHQSPWPPSRRETCKRLAEDPVRTRQILESLLRSDQAFEQSPDEAYALAWGLTHFLATTQPKNFSKFLQRVSQLEPFAEAGSSQRWEMFQQAFGGDMFKLTRALVSHIASLR